jgi:hypothetical protein
MDNPQDIHWFSGFFEGEGSFSFRERQRRGNNVGFFFEPKISISNTNKIAIELCEKILQQKLINYSKTKSIRTGKIDCYDLSICSNVAISLFVDYFKSLIECDKVRLECFQQFVNSRMQRTRYSLHNDKELEIVEKHNQWRSSETTREVSYSYSRDWLAGIYEAEGSFTNHSWTTSPIIQLCNTNFSIICKAQYILQQDWINPHIHKFDVTEKHQSFWRLTICGKKKYNRFVEKYASCFRYRHSELEKIKI